jgi:hypothetical protein
MNILENYLNIKKRIETLNNKTNLIVVSKGQFLDKIKIILNTGHIHFGENRVQEALLKWSDYLCNNVNIQLHLIGSLQSNKAKQAFQIFNYIHSLDSEKLAKTFSNLESNGQKKIKYFIQVNIGNEPQKNGISSEQVFSFVNYCVNDLKLNIIGLMCIPPVVADSSQYFKSLSELAKINNLNELSMGMSNDYECATNNGATFVRVGSKIFNQV